MSNIITMLNLINDVIFVSLVNTTLQMTLLIPLIALVIWVFRIKSATTRYSLWLFVMFAIIALPLLTPFVSQIDFAKFYGQRATGEGPDDLMRLRMGGGDVGELSEGGDSVSSTSATKSAVKEEIDVSLFNPVSVAYFVWCAGALFMLCITLASYRRFRKLKICSSDVKEHTALELLSRLKGKLKVRRPITLKVSSEIYTPVSLGIFSHTIILPDSVKTSEVFEDFGSLEMILTHELAHIKRHDYLINFLQNMLKAVFYFHPLFYLMNRNLTREREHVCDDWVIDATEQRSRYAECIIGLLEKTLYRPVNVPLTIAMAERKQDIPRRIEVIMDKKRKITAKVSKKALIAVFLIGFLVLPIIGGIKFVRFAGARQASNKGRVVFVRHRCIWVMDADGENEKQLTNSGSDTWPVWSPDGTKIAFVSRRDGNKEIYVMDADGENQINLSNNPGPPDDEPAWSPDGKKIAFMAVRGGKAGIFVMNADGKNVEIIAEGVVGGPTWSPDGEKIACYKDNGIWVMDADGKNQKMLVKEQANWPAWSPDGEKIAFCSDRDGNYEIYIMDADGSNQKRLTDNPERDLFPGWTSDGKIVFGRRVEIYIMDSDGKDQKMLMVAVFPDWFGPSPGQPVKATGKLKTTWGKIKHELFGK